MCFVFIDGSDDGPLGRPTTIDYFKGTNTLPRVHGSSLYKGSLVGLLSVAVYLCTTLRWNRHPDLDPDLDHVRRGYARVKRDLPRRLPGQQRLPALLGGRSESAAGGRWRGDFRYFLFDLWGRGGRYARGRRGAGGGSGAGAVAIRRRGSTFSFRRGAAPGGRGGFWDRSPWGRAGRTNDGRRRAPPFPCRGHQKLPSGASGSGGLSIPSRSLNSKRSISVAWNVFSMEGRGRGSMARGDVAPLSRTIDSSRHSGAEGRRARLRDGGTGPLPPGGSAGASFRIPSGMG